MNDCEQLHANKFNNFNEIDFTERYTLSKHIHEDIDYLDSLICMKVIEFTAKHFLQRKLQTEMASLVNSIKHFRRK